MNSNQPFSQARRLAKEFQMSAAVEAPPTMLATVLWRVGLTDIYWQSESAIGPVFIAASDQGISAVARGEDAEAFHIAHHHRTGRYLRHMEEPPANLTMAVASALSNRPGKPPTFDLRGLTGFEIAVLRKALEIPRGEVRPYGWVAREIGHPGAARAVGTALANNPVPLLIPCHRVVRGDGVIGNYIFGTDAKVAMLESEHAEPDALSGLARQGIRYAGSDTTRIFCFPSCRHARRITQKHTVWFTSEEEARGAGYRPCNVCRPALAS